MERRGRTRVIYCEFEIPLLRIETKHHNSFLIDYRSPKTMLLVFFQNVYITFFLTLEGGKKFIEQRKLINFLRRKRKCSLLPFFPTFEGIFLVCFYTVSHSEGLFKSSSVKILCEWGM